MSHMVIYRGPDSKVGYHQTDDIHDAVSFVEQLRNEQGVEHARIFRLEEVNFEYRPYFRVELKAGGPAIGAAAAPAAAVNAAEPVMQTPAAASETVAAAEPVKEVAKVETAKVFEDVKVDEKIEAAAPSVSSAATEADNGVSARRGLFGR